MIQRTRRYSILGGTVVTVAMRWSDRLVGLVSTIILARLLVPDDFGIIAMASLVIALADVLLDFGVNVPLIRNRDATQAHYDTAWTLRLAQMCLATIVVIVAAPYAANYFHDERVRPVLQVMAFSLLLSGFENIGIVAFQKHMQFGAEFRYLFARRIAGFLITVSLAWLLRSYWALVIGALTGRAIGIGLSYLVHPMRPRLSLEKFREVFAVSQWLLIRSAGGYLHRNLHKILVGRWTNTSTMGAYSLADDIAAMPSGELLAPFNRVLFPAFSEVQHNLEELKRLFMLAQGLQTLAAVPAAAGLALVADEAVQVLLGEKWLIAVPFVQVLALVGVVHALATSSGYVLLVLGKLRNLVVLAWTQVLLFVACALWLLPEQEALAVAWLRLAVAAAAIGFTFWLLLRALPTLRFYDVARATIRPLTSAAAMASVLIYFPFPPDISTALLLIFKITLGALIYIIGIFGIWWLAGRPEGAESYLLGKMRAASIGRRASP